MSRGLLFLLCLTLLASCERRVQKSPTQALSSPSPVPTQAESGEWGQARLDVCSFVTTDEVEEVQESPVTIQTKGDSGSTTNANNVRSDLNRDGRVNVGDTNYAKDRAGNSLPARPADRKQQRAAASR